SFYTIVEDRVFLTRPCAASAEGVEGEEAGGAAAFAVPRTIRREIREALANGPLSALELAEAVIAKLATDKIMTLPDDAVERERITREVLDKIARTIDGQEFQFVPMSPDQGKIRLSNYPFA